MRQRLIKVLKRQEGVSLIETILLIIILAISLPAISRLLQQNVYSSVQMNSLNKASYYAQLKLEQIIADYANTEATGSVVYEYITDYTYDPETHETGYTTNVDVTDSAYNGVNYKEISVTCTNPQGSPVTLKTWIVNMS